MSSTPDQLRKIADDAERWDGPALTSWDHIRHQVETMPGSDIPRMNFEALIGELADGLREAADEIERMRRDWAEACKALGEARADSTRLRAVLQKIKTGDWMFTHEAREMAGDALGQKVSDPDEGLPTAKDVRGILKPYR